MAVNDPCNNEEDNLSWFWTFLAVSYIGLWLVIMFGLYGGNPEGCFKKIEKLQAQIKTISIPKETILKETILIDLTPVINRIDEQDKKIKILEAQVTNLMTINIIPEHKKRR